MTPGDFPYCGAELLPHATGPDGTAWPAVCSLPVHGQDVMHLDGQRQVSWRWQDEAGGWLCTR